MNYMTETERIKLLISDADKAPMDLARIIAEEIKDFIHSPQYAIMREAERYYRNRSSVQDKTVDVANRSNAKIEHPILKKLVDQKTNFLLAKQWTVATEDKRYSDALNSTFDSAFRHRIKNLGRAAVKCGVAYMQPYIGDDGKLAFQRIPAAQLIPLWKDDEKSQLDAFIRFYDQTVYTGQQKQIVTHAEFWWTGGVRWFVSDSRPCGSLMGDLHIDKTHGTEANGWTEYHFAVGDKAYNWETPPLVWVRYNEEELPLCYYIRDLIDDYNWQTSVTADVLRDVAKFIYILKNYGGEDLGEFLKDLKENMAIKVDGDGGVDKLQAELNIDAVMQFLDKQRRDLFDFAAAVDTKDKDLGNASGTAINFRYMDLTADCDDLASEFQDAFQRLKLFLDAYYQSAGLGDYSSMPFEIVFNMDLPVNEAEIIQSCSNSQGIISNRTIVQNHPWVTDADEEMQQLEKEKKEAAEDFGGGMFPTMQTGNKTPVNGGDGGDEE